MNLIEFLKTYSKISNKFIDDFFSLYDVDNINSFIINLDKISEWLNTKKGDLKETLTNSYKLNIDYIINKSSTNGKKGAPKENILLSVRCFKLLCMQSRTKKSIEVREYFYLLEELIDKYKNYIICIIYVEGKLERHKRIDPKLATSYLTTNGKSFSK